MAPSVAVATHASSRRTTGSRHPAHKVDGGGATGTRTSGPHRLNLARSRSASPPVRQSGQVTIALDTASGHVVRSLGALADRHPLALAQ